jgi:antibiotic biosynthesis monooxygenase (ABM) superfamily enzyme
MYLYVLKWDINPKRNQSYDEWALETIKRALEVPGVMEVRAYRPLAGESQVVVTFGFEDFDSWSEWFNDDLIQQIFIELYGMAANVQRELWEPSPLIPEPINVSDESPEA